DELDGLIISGGDDIHPSLYGEQEMPKAHYDPDRDELEQAFISKAMEAGMPMLGICRGYQLMNVVSNGFLHNDIRHMRSKTSNWGTVFARKTANIKDNSYLASLVGGGKLSINSLHHQAVKTVGKGFTEVATDLDGFIQATEHDNQKWLGVQWHPEYLWYLPRHRKLIKWLVQTARGFSTA
ncbi:MAG: gamma-glutamyl-gamma-aminobutyrate hydrolase family protein, partial [Limnobacter sp.]|nr:gamma-glutamyl-gamma-aminobutyrate hydrolase family protein [Limnobacter sp.]